MNGEKLSEPAQKEGKPDESNLNNLINTNFTNPNDSREQGKWSVSATF